MAIENNFFVMGRLVRDPIQSHTKLGTARTFYVVASNEHFVDRSGRRQQRTDFIPVTTYGQQAVNDMKYLRRGKEVAVRGRIRQWYSESTKQGGFEFEADAVRYLGSPGGQDPSKVRGSQIDSDSEDADILEFVAQMDAVARTTED